MRNRPLALLWCTLCVCGAVATAPVHAGEPAKTSRPATPIGQRAMGRFWAGFELPQTYYPRTTSGRPRLALVERERRILEQLLTQLPPGSPERPRVLRRLAESSLELTSCAVHAKDRALAEQGRLDAAEYYSALIDGYPEHADIAEDLFYAGFVWRDLGILGKARELWLEAVRRAPDARFAALAWLGIGDTYFAEAVLDPTRLLLARDAWTKALAIPVPQSDLQATALLKLGYVAWNQGDTAGAFAQFEKAIAWYQAHPRGEGAWIAASDAVGGALQLFAQSQPAASAFSFFRRINGMSASPDRAADWVISLVQIYLDDGRPEEAISAAQSLLASHANAKVCEQLVAKIPAVRASKACATGGPMPSRAPVPRASGAQAGGQPQIPQKAAE